MAAVVKWWWNNVQVEQWSSFFWISPKARLEREAEEAIAVAADRAHNEAIVWVCSRCSRHNLILFFRLHFDVLKKNNCLFTLKYIYN